MLVGFFQTLTEMFDVPAVISARGHTITIPPFTYNYYTISGSGSFYATGYDSVGFKINFSRKTVSTSDTCSSTFTLTP